MDPKRFLLTLLTLLAPAALHAVTTHPGGLPRLVLTTDDHQDITSKEDDREATVAIDPGGSPASWRYTGRAVVRGRGNSTWLMPKRPYKIRLHAAASLCGMGADREWSLLANFADKSLMRNLLANHLGARLRLDFTPRNQSVLLNLNGREQGVYVLSEEINPGPHHLNLNAADVTGGYLLEIDQRRGNPYFTTDRGVAYAIAEPKHPSAAQRAFISGYVQDAERALYGADFTDPRRGYAPFVDLPSFVDWYLVNEIMKNSDAANFSSIYLHKNAGQPLRMGPLWDFDLSAGNTDYTDALLPEGWWIRTQSSWFKRLFEDPRFAAAVRARWAELPALGIDLDGVARFIDRTAGELDSAQALNFSIWKFLDVYVWPNAIVTGSYGGEVEYLKSWLITRMRWMDSHLRIPRGPN